MFKSKKETIIRKFILLIVMSIILINLCGCKNDENKISGEKIEEEILYMDSIIYGIIDDFAKGNYNEKVEEIIEENVVSENAYTIINYEKIKEDIEKINTSLDTTMIDLSNENVNINTINSLSDNMNNLIINASRDDINVILEEIRNIDISLLDSYTQIDVDENKKVFRKIKSSVLDAFVSSIIYEDKNISKEKINTLVKEYSEKMKDVNFLENNPYVVNNIYVLIQELKKAIDLENEELIKIKYISLVEML